jgi:Tol biopolymer transport system component/tetratricopeptide (TPR) repeat protein
MTDQELPASDLQPPRRLPLRRALGGCLLAFACIVLIYLAIGGAAVYQGLQERVVLNQQEAAVHYQRGVDHMKAGEYDLAIAEFQHTLRLDPSHREARDALREAKTIAMAQPTPTSATLNEAQVSILSEAEALVQAQQWPEAVQRLNQLHDLSPDFQAQRVSELLYTANFNLGLQQVQASQMGEARHSFEQALAERPGDAEATRQIDLASLYASAQATWGAKWPDAINFLEQLYTLAPGYLDVKDRLYQAYKMYGDALAAEEAWCLAERQYGQAAQLQPGSAIQSQWDEAVRLCRTPTVTPGTAASPSAASITGTATVTATATLTSSSINQPVSPGSGSILFSRFNEEDAQWEIVSVTPGKGSPAVILSNATQPAVSPNGQLLLYHTENKDSEGLHVLNMTTHNDTRVTKFREDVTPNWAPDNLRFVFPSQRSGDRRWQIYIDWADGKGQAVILAAGRSPAWSPDGTTIAYQGSDPQGNEPGLYLVSAQGGPAARLTNGESDRAPAWSPACTAADLAASVATATVTATTATPPSGQPAASGCRIAFMSSQSGNWEIYTAGVPGGAVQRLTSSPGNDGLPTWSPDGSQIAFISDRDGSWGVYVMSAAGGDAVKVADWGNQHADWLVERITWLR